MNKITLLAVTVFAAISAFAQPTDATNFSKFKRDFKITGLVQARYTHALTDSVDYFGNPAEKPTNAFAVKRARIMLNAKINDRFDGVIRFNFADFINGTKARASTAIEFAFIRYNHNRYLNVVVGRHSSYFGTEDYAGGGGDKIKSFEYSNQYDTLRANGWQGFQTGVTVHGNITKEGKMPLRYFASVANGNDNTYGDDKDSKKNVLGRLEAEVVKNTTIGAAYVFGSKNDVKGNAWGVDATTMIPLNEKWKLELRGEYKSATNFGLYNSEAVTPIDDCRMAGFYVLPNIRYECNMPRLRAVEFSSRFESFDKNVKNKDNDPLTSIVPMFNFEFADDYCARLQVGAIIDMKGDLLPKSRARGIAQLQVRF